MFNLQIYGQMIEGFYKFNSYRLGYRRDVLKSDRWTIGVGFTAKISQMLNITGGVIVN